jgi:acyl-CoA synthetase (AMP-forming)/AMP-acid ligase II
LLDFPERKIGDEFYIRLAADGYIIEVKMIRHVSKTALRVADHGEFNVFYSDGQLAHFKAPRTVIFGPLPKTATGKIQKFLLRERAKTAI